MIENCTKCGELCCGKLKIQIRKGSYKSFCSNCFNLLRFIPMKDIRKIVKQNKHGVTC